MTLTELPYGGWVLVDHLTLDITELVDDAARLLRGASPNSPAAEDFIQLAATNGWLR